ncbi:MAG: phage tail protein [Cyclobacteriaceae bacterium]
MSLIDNIFDLADTDPALSHRFGVYFLTAGLIPYPLDFKFQKVSGLNVEIQTETIVEGGQNLFSHRLPNQISYNNLVLERGYNSGPIPSALTLHFNATFTTFKFAPMEVMVILYNEFEFPIGSWLFQSAYPVKWSVSDLDAQNSSVVIDSMELAYSRFQSIRI